MLATLKKYLTSRSFVEVPQGIQQQGISVRAYENGEFRVHVVNEREGEVYVQVAPLGKPEERRFLSGVVAFLTEDESVTHCIGPYAQWLEQHHAALVTFLASTPEAQAHRVRFDHWVRDFAQREQARLAALAAANRDARKPWWRFW